MAYKLNESSFTFPKIAEDKYYERVIDDFLNNGVLLKNGNKIKIETDDKEKAKQRLMELKPLISQKDLSAIDEFKNITGINSINEIEKNVYSGVRSGRKVFSNPTAIQEAIQGLLLGDKLRYSGSITDWLRASDPELETGIFEYISKTGDSDFEEKWNTFIDDWGPVFENVEKNKSKFRSAANEVISGDIYDYDVIHPLIKGCNSIGLDLFRGKGKDLYDKSDIYFCNDNKVLKDLVNLKGDRVNYSKYMFNNRDKILGVSLKRSSGDLNTVWDMEPFTANDFSGRVWFNGSNRTYNLNFELADGNILVLTERSNQGGEGKSGTLEFKQKNGKAQMGKAVTVFRDYLNENGFQDYVKAIDRYIIHGEDYLEGARILMKLFTGVDDLQKDVKYLMSEEGKTILSNIINVACGYQGRNLNNERVTAPYIKVF